MFLQRVILKENTLLQKGHESKRLQVASLIFNVGIPESLHAPHSAVF